MSAGVEAHDDMVPRSNLGDGASNALDDTGTFMTKHDGLRHRECLVAHRQISMAYARGYQAHQDFILAHIIKIEGLQRHRRAHRTHYGSFYLHFFSWVAATA